MKTRTLALALVLSGTLVGLTGCFPIVAGGMVGGVMLVSDRRTSGTVIEDETIEQKAAARIRENLGERGHVNVTSYSRQVLLTGEVPSAQDKQLVEKLVSGVENVNKIVNELAVMGNSSLTQRSSDSLITSKAKANLLDAKDLPANAFKVVTERGTTYLLGRVTQREANRGTDIVRATSGVQRVVRVLEIISEEELARMMPKPQPASSTAPQPSR